MNNLIVLTNNPDLADIKLEKIEVDGDFEKVLLRARDLVHQGYRLISHPLSASSRMFLSPYRSLLMLKQSLPLSEESLALVENGILTYRTMTKKRKPDTDNANDYKMVDKNLLISTLSENMSLWQG